MNRSIVVLALSLLAGTPAAFSQRADQPLPEEARKRLDYAIGKWTSRTEIIGEDGAVRATQYSDDERRFVIENRVVEIVGVDRETGQEFSAFEYYDAAQEKYCLTSIDRDGRLITMKGDPGELFRWTSDDLERADGTTVAIRFTHTDFEPNSFLAVGELSRDSGKSWRVFSRQHMTRQPPSSESDLSATGDLLSPEVRHYLESTLGRWRSQTQIFDKTGKIAQEYEEEFLEEVLMPNHLNLHTSLNADGTENKAFRFFSPDDERVYLVDVTAGGQLWILSGELGEDVMISQERTLKDGRKATLRMTHFNIEEDAFEATSEVSFDGGKSWRKVSHQAYEKASGQQP